jgi:hypothetical protein
VSAVSDRYSRLAADFGERVAAVLMPAVLPLRAVFYPLSLVLLGITLVWAVARAP